MPELVPIRYGRMLVSPFTFYRGAALIMAEDLSSTPRSGMLVQCCGDAHLSNFGVFASPDRRLVFDLNDFDETLPGPWEWDVKRLVVSMLIAARDNGFPVRDQERIVLETVKAYRTAMREFAGMRNLDVWYARLEAETLLKQIEATFDRKRAQRSRKQVAKARTRDSLAALAKLTEVVDGEPRIADQSPLIVPITTLADRDPERRRWTSFAACSASTGRRWSSIAGCCWRRSGCVTSRARSWASAASARARGSRCSRAARTPTRCSCRSRRRSLRCFEPFLGPSEFTNHGQRVVTGQRLMQAASDIFLGWVHVRRGSTASRATSTCAS